MTSAARLERAEAEALAGALGGLAELDAPLGRLTTYRVGGPAMVGVRIGAREDLARLADALGDLARRRGAPVPLLVVGRGSNLLVADEGFPGVAVWLGPAWSGIARLEGYRVRLAAAAGLPVAARQVAQLGLGGLSWGVGVPGSVGGAVRMNAGGHGSDMAAIVSSAAVADLTTGEVVDRSVAELGLGYRSSLIEAHEVVLFADVVLEPGDPRQLEAEMAEIVRWRREHQPGARNAGSVFVNPRETAAARLVEEAGLKGRREGSAQVSPKHANFIVADPGGRAGDVARLAALVADEVERRFGVRLVPEVRLVGFEATGPLESLLADAGRSHR